MNLTWHLIRKDLHRSRWALLCWAAGLGYLFVQNRAPVAGNLGDYLQFTAMLVVLVLGIGLVADLVQADHPLREDSHWRTLPISAGRMVTAKLLLLGAIFVAVPVSAAWLRNLLAPTQTFRLASEYALVGLILSALTLSLAAAAACTRNVVHCVALWLALLFGAGALASYLNRFMPALDRKALAMVGMNKALVILGLSAGFGLAVILNQYLRRRPATSALLLLFGAVGSALVGAFWGYFYLYQS